MGGQPGLLLSCVLCPVSCVVCRVSCVLCPVSCSRRSAVSKCRTPGATTTAEAVDDRDALKSSLTQVSRIMGWQGDTSEA